jgi:hypothetical protein
MLFVNRLFFEIIPDFFVVVFMTRLLKAGSVLEWGWENLSVNALQRKLPKIGLNKA